MNKIQRFLIESLFTLWGGGDSPPPATSTTSTTMNFSPEESARRVKVFDAADALYNKDAYSSILNPIAAPVQPSADTIAGQNMVRNAATGPGQVVADAAGGALNFGLSGAALDPNTNPGFQASLNTAIRRTGQEFTDPNGVMSKIRGNFTAGNSGGSGTREGIAAGIAGREYLNTVGDISGRMASDAYGKGLDLMKSSMAFAPNAYNLMMQPGMTVGAVGAQKEAYDQTKAQYDVSTDMWNANKGWSALAPYAQIVTGMSNPTSTTTATAPMGRSSGGMGLMGGAMMGAQMGGMFGSPMLGAGAGAIAGLFGL